MITLFALLCALTGIGEHEDCPYTIEIMDNRALFEFWYDDQKWYWDLDAKHVDAFYHVHAKTMFVYETEGMAENIIHEAGHIQCYETRNDWIRENREPNGRVNWDEYEKIADTDERCNESVHNEYFEKTGIVPHQEKLDPRCQFVNNVEYYPQCQRGDT